MSNWQFSLSFTTTWMIIKLQRGTNYIHYKGASDMRTRYIKMFPHRTNHVPMYAHFPFMVRWIFDISSLRDLDLLTWNVCGRLLELIKVTPKMKFNCNRLISIGMSPIQVYLNHVLPWVGQAKSIGSPHKLHHVNFNLHGLYKMHYSEAALSSK
jgi:hypothetical protein